MEPIYNKKNNLKINFKKLKRFSIKLEKKLHRPSLIILTGQLLILGFIFTEHKLTLNQALPKIKFNIRGLLSQSFDTGHSKDYLNYGGELIKSFLPSNKLPRVDLNLKFKALVGLDCDRQFYRGEVGKTNPCSVSGWEKGTLLYEGEKYPIKLRAKGDRWIHRKDLKTMSFKIDIRGQKKRSGG